MRGQMILKGSSIGWILLWCALLAAADFEAMAAQPDLEEKLLLSLALDKQTGERVVPSANAVKAYIAGGYVSRKPDLRFDYTDYRKLRKPAWLFGYSIVVIEEEYMAEYVGCCVSPGLGVVLFGKGDSDKLAAFARANGCSVEHPADVSGELADLNLGVPSSGLTRLSCRDRDVTR